MSHQAPLVGCEPSNRRLEVRAYWTGQPTFGCVIFFDYASCGSGSIEIAGNRAVARRGPKLGLVDRSHHSMQRNRTRQMSGVSHQLSLPPYILLLRSIPHLETTPNEIRCVELHPTSSWSPSGGTHCYPNSELGKQANGLIKIIDLEQ